MSDVPSAWVVEAATLVALLRERRPGVSRAAVTADVLVAGSATQVWEHQQESVLLPDRSAVDEAEADLREWLDSGLTVTTVLDPSYPQRLRGIREAPPIIFTRGELVPADLGVSAVGSRKASERGQQIARGVAQAVAARGLSVVSGLAAGIDATAHQAALEAGARTVAVIGTGIRQVYPTQHRQLQEEIAERGLVLSQFWPDTPPTKQTFPVRNATMSGYGIATVVVEAGEHSGARIQARVAVEHGRPVILTDLVAAGTEWGRLLSSRPGVFVVSGVSDVEQVLDHLQTIEEDRRLLIEGALL